MRTIFAVTLIGAGLALTTPSYALTNLLANGGFESAANGPASGSNTDYYNIGPIVGPGNADHAVPPDFIWSVSHGNVDIISYAKYGPGPNANSGSYGLDLVGYGSTGEISQNLNTVLGRVYTVSFDYKANPGISAPMAVVFDGGNIGTVTGTTSWQTFTSTFVGAGGPGSFGLDETFGGGNGGVFLDNVSVTAVPELATWISMLLGFGLLGSALRFGARKQGAPAVA